MIGVNEHATVEIYVGCDFTMALANGRCVSTWTRFNHLHLTSTVIILSILVIDKLRTLVRLSQYKLVR